MRSTPSSAHQSLNQLTACDAASQRFQRSPMRRKIFHPRHFRPWQDILSRRLSPKVRRGKPPCPSSISHTQARLQRCHIVYAPLSARPGVFAMAHEAPIRHTTARFAIPTPSRLRCSHTLPAIDDSAVKRLPKHLQRQRQPVAPRRSATESEANTAAAQLALLQNDA